MSGVGEFVHFVGLLEVWIWEDSRGSWGTCDVWEGGRDVEGLGGMAVRGGSARRKYSVESKVRSFPVVCLTRKLFMRFL